jgi:hypothetical protein
MPGDMSIVDAVAELVPAGLGQREGGGAADVGYRRRRDGRLVLVAAVSAVSESRSHVS